MYKCRYCGKEFEKKQSLGSHVRRCLLHPKKDEIIKKWKLSRYGDENYKSKKQKHNHICKYCGNEFEKWQKLSGHVPRCSKNPNYEKNKIIFYNIGKKFGGMHSEQHRLNIQKGMKKAVREGRQKTPKPGGICKAFKIKNLNGIEQYIQGSWEKIFVEFLNSKNINWERNHVGVLYYFNKDEKMYFPDFYLKDFNLYIEVKGYETEKDKAKFSQFPFKLIIIRKKEIYNLETWFNFFLASVA